MSTIRNEKDMLRQLCSDFLMGVHERRFSGEVRKSGMGRIFGQFEHMNTDLVSCLRCLIIFMTVMVVTNTNIGASSFYEEDKYWDFSHSNNQNKCTHFGAHPCNAKFHFIPLRTRTQGWKLILLSQRINQDICNNGGAKCHALIHCWAKFVHF